MKRARHRQLLRAFFIPGAPPYGEEKPVSTEDQAQKELAQFESQIMGELRPDPAEEPDQQAAAGAAGEQTAPAQTQQPVETPAQPAQPSLQNTEPPKEAPKEAPSEAGDLRPALRAARHAERRALATARDLQKQLDDALAGKTTAKTADVDVETAISRTEVDFPDLAKVMRAQQAEIQQLRSTAPAQAPAKEFVPEVLPDAWQDLVDGNPTLLTWQTSQEHQDRWTAAKRADAYLQSLPAWQNKPVEERLKEAVRRVHTELGTPAAVQTVVDNTKPRSLETLSDLRGGIPPNANAPDYSRMNDEEITASLNRFA